MRFKSFIFTLILGIFILPLSAQCIQRGRVICFDGTTNTPLPGVSIMVKGASSAISDANGEFTLRLNTMSPGEKLQVISFEKEGYSIFNSNSLQHWLISRDSNFKFTVIMSPTDKMKEIRDEYMCNLNATYQEQHMQHLYEIKMKHQSELYQLDLIRQRIDAQRAILGKQLLIFDNYIARLDSMTDRKTDVRKLQKARDRKIENVDLARSRILDLLKDYTSKPELQAKADSIYLMLYKRYPKDLRLRQQYAEHVINTCIVDGVVNQSRLSLITEPLVGILKTPNITPQQEVRARLALTRSLIGLKQFEASEEQCLRVIRGLESICTTDRDFYHEILDILRIDRSMADYKHPALPIMLRYSDRYIGCGSWDFGLYLLNEVYNNTDQMITHHLVEKRLQAWGLLPDKVMNIKNER